MRGCLTQQRTTELDLPWSNFLMETQKLVKEVRDGQLPNIGNVLAGFSNVISDAIMYATLNSPSITTKVSLALLLLLFVLYVSILIVISDSKRLKIVVEFVSGTFWSSVFSNYFKDYRFPFEIPN